MKSEIWRSLFLHNNLVPLFIFVSEHVLSYWDNIEYSLIILHLRHSKMSSFPFRISLENMMRSAFSADFFTFTARTLYRFHATAQQKFTCSKSALQNTRKTCEICSKLTTKTPKRHHRRHSGELTVNSEHIPHIFHCFYCWQWTNR